MLGIQNAHDTPALAWYGRLLRHQVDDRDTQLLAQLEGVAERGMLARLDVVMHDYHDMRKRHLLLPCCR